MSLIHDLTLYAAAHPWAVTAAVLLVLIVLIASLVWLWQRQAEEILSLYKQPDDDPHRIPLRAGVAHGRVDLGARVVARNQNEMSGRGVQLGHGNGRLRRR